MQHQQPMMVTKVVTPGMGGHMPHAIPNCHKCGGTRMNLHTRCPCDCVCRKCGGSGWNAHKNKPCKKMKCGGSSSYGYGGGKHKKYKKHKGKKWGKFGFKKFF